MDKPVAFGMMRAMRLRIRHGTVYHHSSATKGVIQTLRLTPRNHDGQYVTNWRIEVSEDSKLYLHEDAFGNITHSVTADGTFTESGQSHHAVGTHTSAAPTTGTSEHSAIATPQSAGAETPSSHNATPPITP